MTTVVPPDFAALVNLCAAYLRPITYRDDAGNAVFVPPLTTAE